MMRLNVSGQEFPIELLTKNREDHPLFVVLDHYAAAGGKYTLTVTEKYEGDYGDPEEGESGPPCHLGEHLPNRSHGRLVIRDSKQTVLCFEVSDIVSVTIIPGDVTEG